MQKINVDATDIYEHLQTLADLAKECNHVTEMGVRYCVSTWAFVDGLNTTKGKLVSIDINNPPEENLQKVKDTCKNWGIEFEFRLEDTTKMEIEQTDLLFIDTNHTKEHLKAELGLHSHKAKRYIVMHDTESCKELWQAIGWLLADGDWKVKRHYQNCNGLTVLERIV